MPGLICVSAACGPYRTRRRRPHGGLPGSLTAAKPRRRLPHRGYKYVDDQGSYLAALITYYAFVSLFPALLLLTTVLGVVWWATQSCRSSYTSARGCSRPQKPSDDSLFESSI
jgi:hypothetical protein